MDVVANTIEQWFKQYSDEGEFVLPVREMPYSFFPPSRKTDRMVYCTKPSLLAGVLDEHETPGHLDFAVIGRYGLPSYVDVSYLRGLMGQSTICFLGDLDPVDLLVYVWLRRRLSPLRIAYLGVSDAVLDDLGEAWSESLLLPLCSSEKECISALSDLFGDLREMIGTKCDDALRGGFKLELDAIISRRRHGFVSMLARSVWQLAERSNSK